MDDSAQVLYWLESYNDACFCGPYVVPHDVVLLPKHVRDSLATDDLLL
jgi:hypothetical protein